ncbi:MAG: hypothetical protein ACT4ON_08090 [Bacteroidota bacterium]
MSDKKISQLDPSGALLRDDLFVIARENSNKKITMDDINIIDIEYNDLEEFKNDEQLIRGQWYYITDRFVYARAASSKELFKDAFFRKHIASKGSISLLAGSQGSINTIEVDGVDILGTPVPFNTDIETTVADLAGLINTYVSTPDYTAVARGEVLDIYSEAVNGIASNGFSVTGTESGAPGNLALGSAVDMNSGKESILAVKYDFDEDVVTEIETEGFRDTEIVKDQVGVHTGSGQEILELSLENEQKVVIEGTLEGFMENYNEGYSARVYITCWKSSESFYTATSEVRICTLPGSSSSAMAMASDVGSKPAFGSVEASFKGELEVKFSGEEVEIDVNYNGFGLQIEVASGQLEISVYSAPGFVADGGYEAAVAAVSGNASAEAIVTQGEPSDGSTPNRNWVFTYTKKTLINNY